MTDLTLLLEAFRRNARVNDTLTAALTPEEFSLTDGRGGWTVERHLRHMAGFRVGWLGRGGTRALQGGFLVSVSSGRWGSPRLGVASGRAWR